MKYLGGHILSHISRAHYIRRCTTFQRSRNGNRYIYNHGL